MREDRKRDREFATTERAEREPAVGRQYPKRKRGREERDRQAGRQVDKTLARTCTHTRTK